MEEGKRMFSIFAARMFEQRVLQAYREKVAQERQLQLLRELEDEDKMSKEREEKKQREKEKKNAKKRYVVISSIRIRYLTIFPLGMLHFSDPQFPPFPLRAGAAA